MDVAELAKWAASAAGLGTASTLTYVLANYALQRRKQDHEWTATQFTRLDQQIVLLQTDNKVLHERHAECERQNANLRVEFGEKNAKLLMEIERLKHRRRPRPESQNDT